MVRPSQRREMVRTAVTTERTAIQHACTTFAVSETCYRYAATRPAEDDVIADWLLRLTTAPRNGGFGPSWPHSGFDVHTAVWVSEDDRTFATQLARYCARNPVALERLTYERTAKVGPADAPNHTASRPVGARRSRRRRGPDALDAHDDTRHTSHSSMEIPILKSAGNKHAAHGDIVLLREMNHVTPSLAGGRDEPIPYEMSMEDVQVSDRGSFLFAVPGTDTAGARVSAYVTWFRNDSTRRYANTPAISHRLPNSPHVAQRGAAEGPVVAQAPLSFQLHSGYYSV